MRPREDTSAEPIVCADVNEGLIEVSPSLVKPVAAVKPPSEISGRFLSEISLERLLDQPRRRVDADDVEPTRAHVLELVRRLWAYDRDVAGTRLDVFAVRGDPCPSTADDLSVILEDGERLADDDPADAEAARELGLGGKRVSGCPDARLDLLLQCFLKLIVQGDKAVPIELEFPERTRTSALGEHRTSICPAPTVDPCQTHCEFKVEPHNGQNGKE